MTLERINMDKVPSVRLTSIVDNNADRSFSQDVYPIVTKRFKASGDFYYGKMPVAEHGFSMLLEIDDFSLLIDAGISVNGLSNNLSVFGIAPSSIGHVLVTHGHRDHFGGLAAVAPNGSLKDVNLYIHAEGFNVRKFKETIESEFIYLPSLNEAELLADRFNIVKLIDRTLINDNKVMISGEIIREERFNNYLPFHYTKIEDKWVLDPFVKDEMYVAVNVEDKGLIIVSGCGHAGIINIINHAVKITGEERIYGVIGGFHLYHETELQWIMDELEKFNPEVIIPTHCTGWKAIHEISKRFPKAFIQMAVGTVLEF